MSDFLLGIIRYKKGKIFEAEAALKDLSESKSSG
jgi:hypothetical protein